MRTQTEQRGNLAHTPPTGRNSLRSHKKSRGGCRNCKLRSIKCDENRPQCKKCVSYGVHCNFVHGVSEMQLAAVGAFHIIEPKSRTMLIARHDLAPCREASLLARFRSDVAGTISLGRRLNLFKNQILHLSTNHPALRHTIISVSLMYEREARRSMCTQLSHRRRSWALTEQEIGHWYLASSCFNADLKSAMWSSPSHALDIERQAALSATSALLVALTFSYLEASIVEEAWPLACGTCPSNSEDLQWIRLSNGKLSAQLLVQGLKSHPIFSPLVVMDEQDTKTLPSSSTILPVIDQEILVELKQLLPGPEVDTFKQIADSDCMISIIFAFWSFVGAITASFEYGLKYKEPNSLLILLYWYAKLNPLPVWWLKARTSLEGRAICVYLLRYHGHNLRLMRLLQWPVSVLFDSIHFE